MQGYEVISVHDGVDQAVENDGEVNITVISDVQVKPIEQKDREMVIHVKE